jgi:hypothetical protein
MPEYRVRRTVVNVEEVLITADTPAAALTEATTKDDLAWKTHKEYRPVAFSLHTLDGEPIGLE